MYNTLMEVPDKIRDFYYEDIRQEFDYFDYKTEIDEEGNEYQVKFPVYKDVVYIIELKPYDLKTIEDVKACMINAQGKKDDVVDYYIKKALENEKFEFLADWKAWEAMRIHLEEVEEAYVPIEDVDAPDFEEIMIAHLLKEPKQTIETIEHLKIVHYAEFRKAEYDGYSSQFNMMIDGTWEDFVAKVKLKYPKE